MSAFVACHKAFAQEGEREKALPEEESAVEERSKIAKQSLVLVEERKVEVSMRTSVMAVWLRHNLAYRAVKNGLPTSSI